MVVTSLQQEDLSAKEDVVFDGRSSVGIKGTISDGMTAIDLGKVHVAFVVDESSRLVGTLSDGDVRRALLSGAVISAPLAPYICRNPVVVSPGYDPSELALLFERHVLTAIPVVDEQRRVIDVLTPYRHVSAGPVIDGVVAVIMAGGEGLRLRPLTQNTPKPMLKVGDRPMIEHIVNRLVRSGVRDIFIAINYLGEVIEAHFGDGSAFGANISYLREKDKLGTAGALTMLPEDNERLLLVMNGDIIIGAEYDRLVNFHRSIGGALTMAVARHEVTIPFGVVNVTEERVVSLEEKPVHQSLVNAGIYVIHPRVIRGLPVGKRVDMTDVVVGAISAGERVVPFPLHEVWLDIGTHDQLERAHDAIGVWKNATNTC